MNRIVLRFLTAFLCAAFPALAFCFGNSPPPSGYTGAARFRENSCVECHAGGSANSGPGRVALTFNGTTATTYATGSSVPIQITITDTGGGRRRWGFELSARFSDGTQAGDFANVSNATAVFSEQSLSFPSGGTIRWATHNIAQSFVGTSFTFSITWNAPASSAKGDVIFNVAGNAADGSLDDTNDRIYTAEVRLTAASGNPAPTLSTISPTSATPGGAAFTLTVNGTSYLNTSVVRWNGSARTTTFISATQLNAAILASDIAAAGTASITVFTPTPGGGTSTSATFNIIGAPLIVQGGTVNSASLSPAPNDQIARGQIIAIFGANLTVGGPFHLDKLPMPTVLGNTTVKVGGTPIPLFDVYDSQINAQLPTELPDTGTQQITVTSGSQTTAAVNLTLAATSPGIYTVTSNGKGDGIILDALTNAFINPANPAVAGEIVVIYCTGLGATNTLVPSGTAATGINSAKAAVTVTIGGKDAPVQYAGLVPTLVGLYQINVIVPSGLTGSQLVIITAGAAKSPTGVTMSVK